VKAIDASSGVASSIAQARTQSSLPRMRSTRFSPVEKRDALRLKPAPEILGLVPNSFKDRAMHRDNLGSGVDKERVSLYDIMDNLGITVFPVVKDQAHIANAGANGLPLGLFRPGEAANEIYAQIAKSIVEVN